jgi:hypothetical protein
MANANGWYTSEPFYCKFIVHVKGIPQHGWQPMIEELITIDFLRKLLITHYGFNEYDFIYYRSRLKSKGKAMVELTDDTTVRQMTEEFKNKRMVDLHCYKKPSWYEEPAPKRQCL